MSMAATAVAPFALSTERARATRRWVTAALAATLAGFALGLGYTTFEGVFAPLSDLGAVAFSAALLPLAWHLHRVYGSAQSAASRAVFLVAAVGLPLSAAAALGLIVGDLAGIRPELPLLDLQHLGIALQGLWMVGVGVLGLRDRVFRPRGSVAAIVGGLGFALGAPVSLWMGFETPLFYLAFLVALAGFVTWAVHLRTDLAAASERP